jgi:hypothetical protein
MPSQKPRLNLTLDDDVLEIITRLAKVKRKSKAGMVNELLVDMMPVLVPIVEALEDVENKKNALPHLARMSALASQQVGVINSEMSDLINQIEWVDNK